MANLSNVQNQIDILKGTNEFAKKSVLEPHNIVDVRKFISEKKGTTGWEAHEVSFKEWEALIRKYETEKGVIMSATAAAVAAQPAVGHSLPGALTPPVEIDTLGKFAERKALEADLIQGLTKELDGKMEHMSHEELEKAIQLMNGALQLSWITKLPGMKERAREVFPYEPMLQGIAGAILIQKLQKLGYALYFSGPEQIRVVSEKSDARDVEAKLNSHLAKSPLITRSLQSGLLYLSPSFHTYKSSVTNAEGNLIDPAHVDIKTYTEYLKKKPANTLDPSEKAFLQSSRFYDPKLNFQVSLLQSKDYARVVGLMEQITGDAILKTLIPKGTGVPGGTSSPEGTKSLDNSAAAKAGRGIGGVADILGKIAGAGAGGGMDVLGTAMAEAGPLGSIAIIGAILWSIFSDKGLGFMGTLGAIFGVGLLSKAGELKDILPKGKEKGGDAAVSALAASAGRDALGTTVTPESSDTKPLTPVSLMARAMSKESIHDADMSKELTVVDTIKSMNLLKLQTALKTGTDADWKGALESMKYNTLSASEQNVIKKTITDHAFAIPVLQKYTSHLISNDAIKVLTPEQRQGKSIEQMTSLVIEKENEKKKEAPVQAAIAVETLPGVNVPKGHPTPDSIIKENAGYGDLIILSRMIEYGYLPKVNFSAGEVVGKDGWMPRLLKGVVYVGLAGPVTNNVPGSNWFSGKHRHYEADFFRYLTGLIKAESVEIATRQQALQPEASFQPLKDELTKRRNALYNLTEKLASKEPKAIKEAMTQYRDVAKTPGYAGRIDNKNEFHNKESLKIGEIEKINTRIEAEHATMKQAQEAANVEGATDAQKKAAVEAVEKYNKTLVELEAQGVKNLSQLPQAVRSELATTNPWVAKVATANGGIAAFDAKLTEYSSKGVSKGIMGVGLVGLLWNHQGGVMDLYNKGDFVTLSKLGWDFVAGTIPLISTVHETAMLSNAKGYKDFILGKGYEMGNIEKGFRVAGAVPLGGLITKTVGKGAIAVGEHVGIETIKKSGQLIEGVSDIAVAGAKTVGQVATYGVLGYSAYHMTYDLSNHLIGKEVRPESVLYATKHGKGALL